MRAEIRDSGGGFHVIWRLKEQLLVGTDDFKNGNKLRSQLTRVLCGDPAPDHAAALLRRVNTHNSKYPGEPRLVRVLQEAPPVDLIELEELLDTLGDTPLFAWKPKTNGHAKHTPDAPADRAGPIDIGARFEGMTFKGPGDRAIHTTQVQTVASLLRKGVPLDDVVATVLEGYEKRSGE